ncbi:MAG: hypothetical protein HQM12_04850 [SAR324 cluster bacterium]|nr:hypothetical protein [SAR324 cluster bacterium]
MKPSNNASGYYPVKAIQELQSRGVVIPVPEQVAIQQDVQLERISSGVILYPFTRLSGSQTRLFPNARIGLNGPATLNNSVVGSNSVIGELGPVTLKNTWVGPNSILGSGVAEDAVFLGREEFLSDLTTGMGFRVRKGSLYEEDASSAQHTDTKMTILFPWVTMGSNINFCDALVAGGTGLNLGEFTEIGSGTIHFNFTLRGDKATASLLGDVPNGIFLREERIFIGGNNSLLGPLSCPFGAFTAAGIRVAGKLENGLNLGRGLPTGKMDYNPKIFTRAKHIMNSQINYVGQLDAMFHWYDKIRMFIARNNEEQLGSYQAGQAVIQRNIEERIKQIEHFVNSLEDSVQILSQQVLPPKNSIEEQKNIMKHWPKLKNKLLDYQDHVWNVPNTLTNELENLSLEHGNRYTRLIQNLSHESVAFGNSWLSSIVHRAEHLFHNEVLHKI